MSVFSFLFASFNVNFVLSIAYCFDFPSLFFFSFFREKTRNRTGFLTCMFFDLASNESW